MFLDFFDLREQPLRVTPDPTYLYPTRTHCEALDAPTDGIQSGRGFLALIAEPGLGKTTLLYQVLEDCATRHEPHSCSRPSATPASSSNTF